MSYFNNDKPNGNSHNNTERNGIILIEYPDVLIIPEVCEILRYGRLTVYNLLKTEEIPSLRIGGQYRILKKDLIKYLSKK